MKRTILGALALTAVLAMACKKEIAQPETSQPAAITASTSIPSTQRVPIGDCSPDQPRRVYEKVLLQAVLSAADGSADFKKFVYAESAKAENGDNFVRFKDLFTFNENSRYAIWTPQESEYLRCVVKNFELADPDRPENAIVFVPFTEDINIDSLLRQTRAGAPVGVLEAEYNPETQLADSYITDGKGGLLSGRPVSEDFAWTNDVWVINQDETTTPATDPGFLGGGFAQQRFNGQSERGGIINVTNIGAIEPWVDGKVELKLFEFSQRGTKTNEISMGKTKRKDVKNKWKDYDKFLFNWNTSNIGNYIVEAWIEEDGGSSTTTINQSFPAPCTGCPSTSISYTTQKNDDNMGQTIIQFSDGITQEYNVSYAKVKHKN